MNQINLGGRIARDIEIRYFDSGKVVAEFSIAVDRQKKKNQEKADTDFFQVKAWDQLAEALGEHMKKGDHLSLTGRLEPESWEDKEGGKHTKIVINMERWHYAPKGRKNAE